MSLARPRTQAGRDGLRALRAAPGAALVGLDFDGTLAPIVSDPATARPHSQAAGALRALAPMVGTLAIITGRPATTVVELLGLTRERAFAGLVVAGHYGADWWTTEGDVPSGPADPPAGELEVIAGLREALPKLLAAAPAVADGATIEDKRVALAVHVRTARNPAAALEALRAPVAELAERSGLRVEPGRMVLEIRPPGVDKGAVLDRLIAASSRSAVCYVGDDLADLAAVDAVDRWRAAGGAGLVICSDSDEARVGELATLVERADVVVEGPAGVVRWLADLAAEL